MAYPNIETLLDRYFEGTTSLEEEQQLREFFAQADIPPQLEVYRPWFATLSMRQADTYQGKVPDTSTPVRRFSVTRWSRLAAALLILLGLSIWLWPTAQKPVPQPTAGIDWSKYEPATVEEGYRITANALKTVATNLNHGTKTTNSSLKKVSKLTQYGCADCN